MQKSSRAAQLVPHGHGNYVYAYCNIRTNQVLYSLERTLHPSHLSQLADVGANNNPPKLRKDIWRPLFTVTLPDQRQGLQLFKLLREYRLLHETNWELTEEIKRPYTEKQIEKLKEKLEHRGGSKKETVFDVIKREKKKMRVKMVMDQKANSVADLAAILLRQEQKGTGLARKQVILAQTRKKQMMDEICSLAMTFEKGGMAKLEANIAKWHAQVREHLERSLDRTSPLKRRMDEDKKRRWAKVILDRYKLQRQKMLFAKETVEVAKQPAAKQQAAGEIRAQTTITPTQRVNWKKYVEPYPAKLDPIRAVQEGITMSTKKKSNYITGAELKDIKLLKAPVFTMEGVSVKWSNALDAEYAEEWPASVQHDFMGLVRNTAPRPDHERADTVSDLKSGMWKTRSANWNDALQRSVAEQEQGVEEDGHVAENPSQEQDRKAVLSDIKEQILRDAKLKAGRPVWIWRREEKRMEKQERRNRSVATSASPTGGQMQVDIAAEPTSAENAPTL